MNYFINFSQSTGFKIQGFRNNGASCGSDILDFVKDSHAVLIPFIQGNVSNEQIEADGFENNCLNPFYSGQCFEQGLPRGVHVQC